LRKLFPLPLCENLFQALSFDGQPRPGRPGHLLREFQQILSHDHKDTPTETVLKSFSRCLPVGTLLPSPVAIGIMGLAGRFFRVVFDSKGGVWPTWDCVTLAKSGQSASRGRDPAQIIQARRLAQTSAAQLLDINQPRVSALVNYNLAGFSVERLLHFLKCAESRCRDRDQQEATSRKTARIVMTEARATTESRPNANSLNNKYLTSLRLAATKLSR
jgi:hypothetical protein